MPYTYAGLHSYLLLHMMTNSSSPTLAQVEKDVDEVKLVCDSKSNEINKNDREMARL